MKVEILSKLITGIQNLDQFLPPETLLSGTLGPTAKITIYGIEAGPFGNDQIDIVGDILGVFKASDKRTLEGHRGSSGKY